MQKMGAGLHSANSLYWNEETDGQSSQSYIDGNPLNSACSFSFLEIKLYYRASQVFSCCASC